MLSTTLYRAWMSMEIIIGAAMVKSRRGMGITPILFSFAGWGWELIYRAPPGKDSAACLMTLTAKSTPYSLLMAR